MTNYEIVLKASLDEAQKRIAELEEVGRELLVDAINLYSHYPNNFRNTVEEYFSNEIKIFGIPRGGADD